MFPEPEALKPVMTQTCPLLRTGTSVSCSVMTILWDPMDSNHQAPPSMGFSRQEYWSGLPFLSPRDLPNPGIEPRSPALQADSIPPGEPDPCKARCSPSSLHSDPSVPHSLKRPDQAPIILGEPLGVGGGAHGTTPINPPLYVQKWRKIGARDN